MGWKEFLRPNSEKLFLFALIFVFSVLAVSFNMPLFTGTTANEMMALRDQGYFFGPPSFATVLVVTFAVSPVIIVIAYIMACMIAHPKHIVIKHRINKKRNIKKRK